MTVNDGSGGVGSAQAAIIDITTITVPDPEVQDVQSKRLNLTDRVILYLAGLREPGELSFEYEWSKGKMDRLNAMLGADKRWVIAMPDAGDGVYTKTIPGYLKSNKMGTVTPDGLQMATAIVKVSAAQT